MAASGIDTSAAVLHDTVVSNGRLLEGENFARRSSGDEQNLVALRKLGWKVAVVWECSVKDHGAEVVAGKNRLRGFNLAARFMEDFGSPMASARARRNVEREKS